MVSFSLRFLAKSAASVALSALISSIYAQPTGGRPIIGSNALFDNSVGGLENTAASTKVIAVNRPEFSKALHVKIGGRAAETNATQMTIPNAQLLHKGDAMLASFWMRGSGSDGGPAHIEFLFEKATNPWTKSISQGATSAKVSTEWKHHLIAFRSSETYRPGEAMVSLRFAFQPQTVEVASLQVMNYGTTRTVDDLVEFAISQKPLGSVKVKFNYGDVRQTMLGFGGDFCQPRYGETQPMDAVGSYVLDHLNVVHARVGLPLEKWNPEPGVYRDDAQARASMQCLQEMTRRKIPTVLSVWEGPTWMLPGRLEESGRVLPVAKYDACIQSIGKYLTTARDQYGATVEYFSFNEADYGVNFKFSSREIANFIRRAGPQWKALGLKTKFLVGDCGNGGNLADYALPLLEDKTIAPYLGPISIHCWDALGATDESYLRVAALAKRFSKQVWCLEAGHDSGLWQAPNPWPTWDNGLRTAMAYERTLRLTGASVMDYWTYQDNYPIVDKTTSKPYPVFHVIRQMEQVFGPDARVVTASSNREDLQVLGAFINHSGPMWGFGVLLVNPIGSGNATLTDLSPGVGFKVLCSDKKAQMVTVATGKVSASGTIEVKLPTRSVVTVIVEPFGVRKGK